MATRFRDRREAGRRLAGRLTTYAHRPDVLVVALPRGGVPVAFEVARALGVPLEVFLVRKLGVPGHEELAMGAIASGGAQVLNRDVIAGLGVTRGMLERVVGMERRELARREHLYRNDRPFPSLAGRTVIVVDDGLATGATMTAAVSALRALGPAAIVAAAPIGAPESCAALRALADDCVCVLTPAMLRGVGVWYEDFSQTADDEVRALLAAARVLDVHVPVAEPDDGARVP